MCLIYLHGIMLYLLKMLTDVKRRGNGNYKQKKQSLRQSQMADNLYEPECRGTGDVRFHGYICRDFRFVKGHAAYNSTSFKIH